MTGHTAPDRIHGGADTLGVPEHDFSTNSNACGPCPQANARIAAADASRYPDAGYGALRSQLAAFHQVKPAHLVLAASASEFIFRITSLAALRGTRQVWLPAHSYGDYAQAARAHGLAFAQTSAQAGLLWACEPSSPLGAAHAAPEGWSRDGLDAIAVLDRAYEPLRLAGQPTAIGAWPGVNSVNGANGVWQLWTPNKALGLTGVRAAYAIAPPDQADLVPGLDALAPSWPIGAHGVELLLGWTDPAVQAWLQDTLATLRAWKVRQLAMCESLGWTCLPSDANFFCARPALPATLSLGDALVALRARGIKLRDTTSFGMPGHVRVSVQPPQSQDALHNAWQDIIRTHS